MIEKVTEDYAIVNGKTYVPIDKQGCFECAFRRIPKVCHTVLCAFLHRKDKRSIIWVEDSIADLADKKIRLLKV